MHEAVAEYVGNLKPHHKRAVLLLRELVLERLPHAEEGFGHGFPLYRLRREPVVGIAHRKKGLMLYIMRPELVASYSDRLAGQLDGKSCICLKRAGKPLRDDLFPVIEEMLLAL
ncbi:hypothetical protein FE782_30670 [Paenibacillus antri]|uniref:DUF1801 domain-containing protein n=1 Tax=Paenibacillus antri TaxID=2582848 RepID=A0A5R9G652_9BACL|nr:hypothetical protein [Paenibacillus antri]TLS48434.1 hypothetical protein FE782_30670 [Paenibacillus antri]